MPRLTCPSLSTLGSALGVTLGTALLPTLAGCEREPPTQVTLNYLQSEDGKALVDKWVKFEGRVEFTRTHSWTYTVDDGSVTIGDITVPLGSHEETATEYLYRVTLASGYLEPAMEEVSSNHADSAEATSAESSEQAGSHRPRYKGPIMEYASRTQIGDGTYWVVGRYRGNGGLNYPYIEQLELHGLVSEGGKD